MSDVYPAKKDRPRSCYHRFRMRLLKRKRAIKSNPAQSVALELLALFTFAFRPLPSLEPPSQPYISPPMSPRYAQRLEKAKRLDVAPRYVDIVLSQGMVSYARLFQDIRRGGTSRRDAFSELLKRVPEETLDWLTYVARYNLWSDLMMCQIVNGTDEETDVQLRKKTLAWLTDKAGGPNVPMPPSDNILDP